MWLALPPRTSDGIVATYVKAFEATLKDPQYQAEIAKIDPNSPVASKADLERLVRELAKVSPETLEYIQAELKRQGFGISELKRSSKLHFSDAAARAEDCDRTRSA